MNKSRAQDKGNNCNLKLYCSACRDEGRLTGLVFVSASAHGYLLVAVARCPVHGEVTVTLNQTARVG